MSRWEKAEQTIQTLYDGVKICAQGDLVQVREWWSRRPPIVMDMLMCGFNTREWRATLMVSAAEPDVRVWLAQQMTP